MIFSNVRLKYQDNVLYSQDYRTKAENLAAAKRALCILLNTDAESMFGVFGVRESGTNWFEESGGTIEFYRSTGKEGANQ